MVKITFPGYERVLGPGHSMPEKIYTLPELVSYPYKLNLADYMIGSYAKKNPNKVAMYFKDQKITYREFFVMINRFANGLRSLGLKEYDRVMLMGPNRPEWLISMFAVLKIGAIPVLVNHLVKSDEIEFRYEDAEASAIICNISCLSEVEKANVPGLMKIVYGNKDEKGYVSYEKLIETASDNCQAAETTLDHIERIIYSSGTTGRPKGGVATVRDALSVVDTHARYVLKIREGDIIGGHPNFSFAFGVASFTLYPWRFGASLSIIERFDPEEMFLTIKEHGVTMLACVPTAFNLMLSSKNNHEEDVKSLRLCQSAGEPLSATTYREWKNRYGTGILDSMGSGDLLYWLSAFEGMPEEKVGSVGTLVPGVENIIVDENFQEVHRGTSGELLVRGPAGLMFWKRPDKQEGAVYKGWNRPGIYATQDEDGYFWYLSRTDDIIVTSGYKIPCWEVECAINDHHSVMESVAIPTPDSIRGNVIKALVVLKEGYEPSGKLENEIKDHVKSKLEDYKYPRKIVFVRSEDLPRTNTDKIQRSVLRQREMELAEKQS